MTDHPQYAMWRDRLALEAPGPVLTGTGRMAYHGTLDPTDPRLAQMLADYETAEWLTTRALPRRPVCPPNIDMREGYPLHIEPPPRYARWGLIWRVPEWLTWSGPDVVPPPPPMRPAPPPPPARRAPV